MVEQGPRRRTVQASASSWSSAQEARSPEKEKGHNSDQIIGILECLKQYDLVKTITADNGLQFAEHERVSRATSVGFFFARPYHSWERGANENTNGLIRQYIPKGSDFTNITQEFLEEVERKLNERPRKRHGFLSPNQVFSKSTGLDARVFV